MCHTLSTPVGMRTPAQNTEGLFCGDEVPGRWLPHKPKALAPVTSCSHWGHMKPLPCLSWASVARPQDGGKCASWTPGTKEARGLEGKKATLALAGVAQ